VRVLQVNKFFYGRGGAETAMFQLSHLLERHGHQVIPFAMHDERNRPSDYAEYFVSKIDLREEVGLRPGRQGRPWAVATRILYSREAERKMDALIRATRPDVAHLHNIYHQLSPSILRPLRRHGVPTVLTLHDYKLICPNYSLATRGAVCERCKGHKYYQAVVQRCVKDSRLKSALCALEAYFHRAWGIYDKAVDVYIAPSRFLRQKMIEFGLDGRRIVHLPNFLNLEEYPPDGSPDGYFVYSGRVDSVKGVGTLLEAVSGIEEPSHFELRIAGDGEERPALEARYSGDGAAHIRFLGHMPPADVSALLRRALFSVVPSQWYENAPLTILEAYAFARPVVASRIGGIPELVEDGRTGLLAEPGDACDLRRKIGYVLANPPLAVEMGRNARALVEQAYGPDRHYQQLMLVYAQAQERRAARQT
jgi:glycosyltransferase involved in cell wall biosynthesis